MLQRALSLLFCAVASIGLAQDNQPQDASPAQDTVKVEAKRVQLLAPEATFKANVSSEQLVALIKAMNKDVEQVFGRSETGCQLRVKVTLTPADGHEIELARQGDVSDEQLQTLYNALKKVPTPASGSQDLAFYVFYTVSVTGEQPGEPTAEQRQATQRIMASLEKLAEQEHSQAPASKTTPGDPAKLLAEARRAGWQRAAVMIKHLEAIDGPRFPGLQSWLADYQLLTDKLDPDQPLEQWPEVDVQQLVTANPSFWQATFECAPADPGWALLHSGLLQGCGELYRAQQLLVVARQRPGIPAAFRRAINGAAGRCQQVMTACRPRIEAGIKLYDEGDYAGAEQAFQAVLDLWPQHGWCCYELGLTRLQLARVKQGLPPLTKTVVQGQDDDEFPRAALEMYARTRQHDPMFWRAYQGTPQLTRQVGILVQHGMPVWKDLRRRHQQADIADASLKTFAAVSQLVDAHELALATCLVVVARRGRYQPQDHPFLSKSLRALAPGDETEAALERLAGSKFEAFQLVAPEAK